MGVLMCAAVYFINRSAVEHLLVQDARDRSVSVADYFGKKFPEAESVIAAGKPSPESLAFVEAALETKEADDFKLFSPEGKLILSTEESKPSETQHDGASDINADALEAFTTNEPVVHLEEEMVNGERVIKAETYVPILKDGKAIGVAEVYINQNSVAANFRNSFAFTSALIALLAALAFAIPAYGLHVRTRQMVEVDDTLRFMANHDTLTGLPNRSNFSSRLATGLNGSRDSKKLVALHFVDIDFFKEINDRHGHDFGDDVLRTVADRIKAKLRDGDVVSRFGGDEFVVAQFGIADYEQLAAATRRIVKVFHQPLQIMGREIMVTASIGTAVGAPDGESPDQLIANADTAVYVVKSRGRNGHCFFEPRFHEEKRKRLELERLVRNAVAAQAFEVHFQPLFNVNDMRLKGFEALLRLKNEAGQFVPPTDFIPVAEEIGLIDAIGSWVLERSCLLAAGWPNDLQVSVNLSVAQFRRRSIVDGTRSALARSGLKPARLLLEITESLLLTETDAVLEQLNALKKLGVAIVMDDFGTGYSSLGYMLKFPFDQIKIDRSFVSAIDTGNESARTVVQTIITLGHTLNMNVTAEGVETMVQAKALRDMRCDDAQGYLFGRPMPESEIPILLMKQLAGQMKTPVVAAAQAGAAA